MNAEDHFKAAEALLLSCQMPGSVGETPEQYPAREDDVDSIGHALTAAQVHATLALAARLEPTVVHQVMTVPMSDSEQLHRALQTGSRVPRRDLG